MYRDLCGAAGPYLVGEWEGADHARTGKTGTGIRPHGGANLWACFAGTERKQVRMLCRRMGDFGWRCEDAFSPMPASGISGIIVEFYDWRSRMSTSTGSSVR